MPKGLPEIDLDIDSQEEEDEQQSWRAKNSERLRWEMFLRNFGPDGDFNYLGPEPWMQKKKLHLHIAKCFCAYSCTTKRTVLQIMNP